MARQDSTLGEGGKRKWQEPPDLSQNALLETTFGRNVDRLISFSSTSMEAATIALIACRGNLEQAIEMLEGDTSTILREYNRQTSSYPSTTAFAIVSATIISAGSIAKAAELLNSTATPTYTSVTGIVLPEFVDERTIDSVLLFLRGDSNSKRRLVERETVSSPIKSSLRSGLERSISDSSKRTQGKSDVTNPSQAAQLTILQDRRVSPVEHQRPISHPEFPAPRTGFVIDANGRARVESFVEEPKATRGDPITNEEWESSQSESSSNDGRIVLNYGDMKEQVYAGS
jgi:hypothetical protein